MRKRTDGDVSVRSLEHLVHSLGSERGTEDPSHRFAGGDIGFLSIDASETRLLILLSQYNERTPELVERQRHFRGLSFLRSDRNTDLGGRRRVERRFESENGCVKTLT